MGRPRLFVAGLLLFVGGLLGILSAVDLHPMRMLAVWMSDDGVLSDAYVGLIRDSQLKLAISFGLAGGLLSWIDAQRVVRCLGAIPFRWVAGFAGLSALLLSLAVQEWVFDGIPHVTDATSHLFQAKIFTLGRMYAPAPACPDAFWQPHVLCTYSGKWFTKYTPGHALLLAGGMKLGFLKWVLPLCLMATVVVLGKWLEQYEGKLAGRIGMLLLACSPLALLLGGSYMSHVSAMALALLGMTCWIRGCGGSGAAASRRWAAAGGFLLAASALTRPHEFVLVGIIGFLFSLSWTRAEWQRMLRSLPGLVFGAIPVLGFWMHWNATLYGNPFAAGYGFTRGDVIRPAFQGHLGFTATFGWREALALLAWNLERVNGSFFGWPASLLFVPFAFLRRGGRLLYLAIAGAAVGMGFYFFYDYHAEFESRYYFLVLPFFVYLTVRGIRNLVFLGETVLWRRLATQGVFMLGVVFYGHAALHYWPGYLLPKYRAGYEESTRLVEQAVRQQGLTQAVVMIGPDDGTSFFYSSGFVFNDPLLSGDVVYARRVDGAVECLRHAFSGRTFHEYDRTRSGAERLRPLD